MNAPGVYSPEKKSASDCSHADEAAVQELEIELIEKEAIISALATRVNRLEGELMNVAAERKEEAAVADAAASAKDGPTFGKDVLKRRHPLEPVQHMIASDGTRMTGKLGRRSMATSRILDGMKVINKKSKSHKLAKKFIEIFRDPTAHVDYLTSQNFASETLQLCDAVSKVFEAEPRCLFLQVRREIYLVHNLGFYLISILRSSLCNTTCNSISCLIQGMKCSPSPLIHPLKIPPPPTLISS